MGCIMGVSKVRKRDGTIVRFKPSKVSTAIEKSMLAVGMDDDNLSKDLAEKVIDYVNEIHDDDYIIDMECLLCN